MLSGAEQWALLQVGAILAGRRGPFSVANATREQAIVVAIANYLRETRLSIDAGRIELIAQLVYSVDVSDVLKAAATYYRRVRLQVYSLRSHAVAVRLHDLERVEAERILKSNARRRALQEAQDQLLRIPEKAA